MSTTTRYPATEPVNPPIGAITELAGAARFFLDILDKHFSRGQLDFLIDGRKYRIGQKNQANVDPVPLVRVTDKRLFAQTLAYGNLGLGEAYMARHFDVEHVELYDVLRLMLLNRLDVKLKKDYRLWLKALFFKVAAFFDGKAINVQRHYDIGDDLFESFLDRNMVYSCGYTLAPGVEDIEAIQRNKLGRVCRKLDLASGRRLLDVGCGYGGLLIHAAEHYGIEGVGVTLSKNHAAAANQRIRERGLEDRIRVEFGDYSAVARFGKFDRWVSVGMFEHVPQGEYRRFFHFAREALSDAGRGLLHTIGCNAPANDHDPFIQKYIFPGSNQPRLSEIASGLERMELAILDVENIAEHYAYTIIEWLRLFRQNRDRLDSARYDDVFLRMWEYYFHCGIAVAFASNTAVYQVLFSRDPGARPPIPRV